MKEYDAIVIGSGLSGMSSALLLAKRNKKVALLEQAAQLNPLLAGFDREGGHFETGLHYSSCLGEGEVGRYFFEQLGVEIKVRPCASVGYDEIRLLPTGRNFKMAYGRERLLNNLVEHFPKEKDAIADYLRRMQEAADKSLFLNAHRREWTPDVFFEPRHGQTLQEVLDECFVSTELKAILSTSTFLHGVSPRRVSFVQHSCIVNGMYDSMWELVGGGRALIQGFKTALEKIGVDIFLREQVEKIELLSDGRKVISCASGKSFKATRCVSTIHPKAFFQMAPKGIYREGYLQRARQIPETAGFFCLYAINQQQEMFKGNNVFLLPELNFSEMYPDGKKSPYYISFTHNEPQTANVISFVDSEKTLADRQRLDYRQLKRQEAENIFSHVSALCPDIVGHLKFVGAATPATQKKYVGYSGGYGMMHDTSHVNIMPVTKIQGIYLSGQSVVAPGLLGAMISAFLLDKIIGMEES